MRSIGLGLENEAINTAESKKNHGNQNTEQSAANYQKTGVAEHDRPFRSNYLANGTRREFS
jgi:hypothetical protein